MISIFVPGIPAAQGSKRHVGRGIMIESSKKLAPWRQNVIFAASKEWGSRPPIDAPVHVQIVFRFARPKKHFWTGKRAGVLRDDAPYFHSGTPDLDKLLRGVFDALTQAGVIRDDARIAEVWANKIYAEEGFGAEIKIKQVGEL